MPDHTTATQRVLLEVHETLKPGPHRYYIDHCFTVPEDASRVGMTMTFRNDGEVYLFASLYAPDGFRGACMDPASRGEIRMELWVAPDDASLGALPGELPPGEWRVQVDNRVLDLEVDYRLEVWAEFEAVPDAVLLNWPEDHVVRDKPGWYCGELHSHSNESDGVTPVGEVVEAALAVGLDFLAISDHFTTSQWRPLMDWMDHPIALLRSCELTTERGHANLHGFREWVDVFTDRPGWDTNQAAAATRKQGGLFCVNHPFISSYSWRAHEFDWSGADLMEVFHTTSYDSNSYSLTFWDRLLCAGYHVVGIAGTDSHDPVEGISALGKLVTWVYADELSEQGILAGLRTGRVTISQGAQMTFSAVNEHGQRAEMWESLPAGSLVTLEVSYRSAEPLALMIYKDGFLTHEQNLAASPDDWTAVTCDQPEQLIHSDRPGPGYYRAELHAVSNNPATWLADRNHLTMRAISNPIWVGQEPPRRVDP
jgi:hypothetical protein